MNLHMDDLSSENVVLVGLQQDPYGIDIFQARNLVSRGRNDGHALAGASSEGNLAASVDLVLNILKKHLCCY